MSTHVQVLGLLRSPTARGIVELSDDSSLSAFEDFDGEYHEDLSELKEEIHQNSVKSPKTITAESATTKAGSRTAKIEASLVEVEAATQSNNQMAKIEVRLAEVEAATPKSTDRMANVEARLAEVETAIKNTIGLDRAECMFVTLANRVADCINASISRDESILAEWKEQSSDIGQLSDTLAEIAAKKARKEDRAARRGIKRKASGGDP